jgi:hypothetical protein
MKYPGTVITIQLTCHIMGLTLASIYCQHKTHNASVSKIYRFSGKQEEWWTDKKQILDATTKVVNSVLMLLPGKWTKTVKNSNYFGVQRKISIVQRFCEKSIKKHDSSWRNNFSLRYGYDVFTIQFFKNSFCNIRKIAKILTV